MTILGEDVKSVNEFLYCKLSLCVVTLMLAACGGGESGTENSTTPVVKTYAEPTQDVADVNTLDFLHKSFFNQFNCLSFTQSKLYMPASKLNRRFNLLRRFLYTQDKILKHFILPNTCST